MKPTLLAILILLSIATPSFSEDAGANQKDYCLLGIPGKCNTTTNIDILEKIRRIEIALDKGVSVYTPEELEHLKAMLESANLAMDYLYLRK